MTYETATLLRHAAKEHPAVMKIIKETLAAALEADASADEIAAACRLCEKIVMQDAPSPRFAEFESKTRAALEAIEKHGAAFFGSGFGVADEPGGKG